MDLLQIAPNLYIDEQNSSFGNYNHNIIYDLLNSIVSEFAKCLEIEISLTTQCIIEYHPSLPMCCNTGILRTIFLNTKEDYWCQWIYQFSHEYCHHLINGNMLGEMKGLVWFEESICELASLYHLYCCHQRWNTSSNLLKTLYAPNIQDYLNDLLSMYPQLVSDTHHPGFLYDWLPILEQPILHRDYYNALAVRMYPLFVENPHLWKIILYLGDVCCWHSLEELFDHLSRQADDSYSDSLDHLKSLLLS